jgi:hypothetical protein
LNIEVLFTVIISAIVAWAVVHVGPHVSCFNAIAFVSVLHHHCVVLHVIADELTRFSVVTMVVVFVMAIIGVMVIIPHHLVIEV